MAYVEGIDISHHQDELDWQALWDKGKRFAFIKVSEGTDFEDDRWKTHYNEASAIGFLVGPYHYFRPEYSGLAQFDWHISIACQVKWDFPSANDVEEEENAPSNLIYYTRVRAFNDASWSYWERRPIAYTSAYKWNKLCGGRSLDADLWAAHWTTGGSPYLPKGWTSWMFWQHRGSPLDLDRFNGDYNDLLTYAGQGDSLNKRVRMLENQIHNLEEWIKSFKEA
jgi:GH25 family lysozyme M1 (1,4-beta-N-acetylmuramidase)